MIAVGCRCRGTELYVTFNEQPPTTPIDALIPTKKAKYHERNTFWYYRKDIRWAAQCAPWQWQYIGKWGHPGGQRMIELTRLPDDAAVADD